MKVNTCYLEFGVSNIIEDNSEEICMFKGNDFSSFLCPVCEKSEICLAKEIQGKLQELFPNQTVEYCGSLVSEQYNGWTIGFVDEPEGDYEYALCTVSKEYPSVHFAAVEVNNWSITVNSYINGKIIPKHEKLIQF